MHGQYRGLRCEVDNGHKQHLDLLDESAFTPLLCPLITLAPSYLWALISFTERPMLWMVSRNFVVSSSALVPLSACTKVKNSSRMRCFPSSFLPTKHIQIEICSLFVTSVDSSAINA